MKKIISFVLAFCLVLSCGLMFSSCKKNKAQGSQVQTYSEDETNVQLEEVEIVYVTDSNGQTVTDKNGKPVTESANKTEKSTKFTYEVKGGSDPYVEDPWG